jgi:hypothetical protein
MATSFCVGQASSLPVHRASCLVWLQITMRPNETECNEQVGALQRDAPTLKNFIGTRSYQNLQFGFDTGERQLYVEARRENYAR